MTTFYKKEVSKNGKVSYKPVYQYDNELADSFSEGTHITVCKPGSKSRRYNIDPALGELIAAGIIMQDFMCTELVKNSEAKPCRDPLTEKQQKAWETFKKDYGDTTYISFDSAYTIAGNTIQSLIEHASSGITNPTVKKAWDNFITLAKLVGEK